MCLIFSSERRLFRANHADVYALTIVEVGSYNIYAEKAEQPKHAHGSY